MNTHSANTPVIEAILGQFYVEEGELYKEPGPHLQNVESLLNSGCDVNEKNSEGKTALMIAVQTGSLEITKLLLDRGADANASDSHGKTPLMHAAGVTIHQSNTDIVRLLLDRGADLNAKDITGTTALASMIGHQSASIDIALLLVERGADVNSVNRRGESILMSAVYWINVCGGRNPIIRMIELVKQLLERGAYVNATDDRGRTALRQALEHWHPADHMLQKAIQLLIDAGADINAKAKDGTTAFSYFTRPDYSDRTAALKWLAANGSDEAKILIATKSEKERLVAEQLAEKERLEDRLWDEQLAEQQRIREVQNERLAQGLCVMCGCPISIIGTIMGRRKHSKCELFQG